MERLELRTAEVKLTTGKIIGRSIINSSSDDAINLVMDLANNKKPCVVRLLRGGKAVYVHARIESAVTVQDGIEITYEVLG